MHIQRISSVGSYIRPAIAALAVLAGAAGSNSCTKSEIYYPEGREIQNQQSIDYKCFRPMTLYHFMARDIGLLPEGVSITSIPSVKYEDENGNQIYHIFDRDLNTTGDTLKIKQLTVYPDHKGVTDTLVFTNCHGHLKRVLKNSGEEHCLSHDIDKVWNENENDVMIGKIHKDGSDSFVRESRDGRKVYKNVEITTPPIPIYFNASLEGWANGGNYYYKI